MKHKSRKTWPRGTNSRLPFAVNVTLNLSKDRDGFVDTLATVRLTVFRNMNNEINSKNINHAYFGFHCVVKSRYLDSAIHRINHYPVDSYYGNQLHYPHPPSVIIAKSIPCVLTPHPQPPHPAHLWSCGPAMSICGEIVFNCYFL